jgi:hypothetical protein
MKTPLKSAVNALYKQYGTVIQFSMWKNYAKKYDSLSGAHRHHRLAHLGKDRDLTHQTRVPAGHGCSPVRATCLLGPVVVEHDVDLEDLRPGRIVTAWAWHRENGGQDEHILSFAPTSVKITSI